MPLFELLQYFLAFLNYLWIVDVWHEHIMLPMSWISISTIFELLIVFGLSQEAVRAGSKGAQTHNRARNMCHVAHCGHSCCSLHYSVVSATSRKEVEHAKGVLHAAAPRTRQRGGDDPGTAGSYTPAPRSKAHRGKRRLGCRGR